MKTQIATRFNLMTPKIRLNGLGCPQCSAPLVDSLITIRANGTTQDCNCTVCDFASTYNTETLQLAKNY